MRRLISTLRISTLVTFATLAGGGCQSSSLPSPNVTTAGQANLGSADTALPVLAKWYGAAIEADDQQRPTGSTDPNAWTPAISKMWALVEVSSVDGNQVTANLMPCRMDLPVMGGIQATIPDATVVLGGPVAVVATLSSVTDPNSGAVSVDLDMPNWGAVVYGADLANPAPNAWTGAPADPLPTSGTDPNVVDTDHDGHPGVTITAETFVHIYGAFRATFEMHGTLDPNNEFVGAPEETYDLALYGDNVGGTAVSKAESVIADTEDQPGPRYLRLVPLTGLGDANAPDQVCSAVYGLSAQ